MSCLCACAMAWLFIFVPSPALAKKKKIIPKVVRGEVLDSAENPLAGASVELTDVQTGKKNAIYSQEGGHYEFSDLNRDHDYEIQATYKGLNSEVRKVSSFDDRDTIVINLKVSSPAPH